jgi:Rps23 Pro-64 3,4-dihydroxylase Tpa1-like proline 4-hydroxylase
MILTKCIEDKFFYFENFLPKEEYKRIHDDVLKERKKLLFRDVSDTWDKNLYNNLTEPMKVNMKPSYFANLANILGNLPHVHLNAKEMGFCIHYMKKNSGINWHSDLGHNYAITYYLNHKWNQQWGGEFMYKHEGEFGFIPIIGNSVVIIKSPMMHKVNTVLSPIMPRLSIQSFISPDKKR